MLIRAFHIDFHLISFLRLAITRPDMLQAAELWQRYRTDGILNTHETLEIFDQGRALSNSGEHILGKNSC